MTTFHATDDKLPAMHGHDASTEWQGVALSPAEQKLVARYNERQVQRSALQQRVRKLMTTNLIAW